MISRKILFPVVLATAAGGPYLVLEDGWSKAATEKVKSLWSSSATELPQGDPALALGSLPPAADRWQSFASEYTYGHQAAKPEPGVPETIAGPRTTTLGEVIRFDITPQWISGRWPRITATLAELGMEGLRVPLVTGTGTDDIAGSLTYYFNHDHQVQRITLDGYTGNEHKLLAFVEQYYGLRAERTLDAGMYVARWNGQPTSVLRVTRAPVISANSPHAQVRVLMELNRPNAHYGLSPQFQAMLNRDTHTWRW